MIEFWDGDTFEYQIPGYEPILWSVRRAERALAEGELMATVDMTLEQMRMVVERNYVDPAHLDRVDPSAPGIGAPLVWEGAIQYILIDGNHRCARALRDGRLSYRVRLLTDAGAQAAFLSGPLDLMPWGPAHAGKLIIPAYNDREER